MNILHFQRHDGTFGTVAVEPNPERPRKELGPKQIAWACRKIPGFRASKRDADRSARHATQIAGKVRA